MIVEVEANGRAYDEMHVDGGVTAQVFVYPTVLDWELLKVRLALPAPPTLYVINHSRAVLPWQTTPRRIMPILLRSVDSLIRDQGIGDLAQIYLLTQRDGLRFKLAVVPSSFTEQSAEKFDPEYMRKLCQLGFDSARMGYEWIDGPRRLP